MNKVTCILLALFFSLNSMVLSQEQELYAGIRLQKAIHLYWENGIAAEYTNSHLWQKRVHLGFSYCTSRLGSAFRSNAIKQDNYLIYGTVNFHEKAIIQPILKLNVGFFYSDMENEIFEVLPHKSMLLSMEAGIGIKLKYPVKVTASFGYNFISGNGISNPGTLYPFYYQLTMFYVFHL